MTELDVESQLEELGVTIEGEDWCAPRGRTTRQVAGVEFAPLPPAGSYWPIVSRTESRCVSFHAEDGTAIGTGGRSFGARRGSLRLHAACDLFARAGDPIVACEDGEIVGFIKYFLTDEARTKYTSAILVRHRDVTINYGEVAPDSLSRNGLRVGSNVRAGQVIGAAGVNPGGSSMLHFETYRPGLTQNQRWTPGKAPPSHVLDPTRYLLALAERGLAATAEPRPAWQSEAAPGVEAPEAGEGSGGVDLGLGPSLPVRPPPGVGADAFRKFRLTQYYLADQNADPVRDVSVPIPGRDGTKIADASPAFFAKLSLEGSGLLADGRLVNVAGTWVKADPAVFAPVLAYHEEHLPRRPHGYSGIQVDDGRVVRALAFHVVPHAERGLGYGVVRKVPLQPLRTLAADLGLKPNSEPRYKGKAGLVPAHTRVFIRELAGKLLPDGSIHDGWFVVNDTGGGIFGAHFDVFSGTRALARAVKLPERASVWFDGIETRIPAGYDYGLRG